MFIAALEGIVFMYQDLVYGVQLMQRCVPVKSCSFLCLGEWIALIELKCFSLFAGICNIDNFSLFFPVYLIYVSVKSYFDHI